MKLSDCLVKKYKLVSTYPELSEYDHVQVCLANCNTMNRFTFLNHLESDMQKLNVRLRNADQIRMATMQKLAFVRHVVSQNTTRNSSSNGLISASKKKYYSGLHDHLLSKYITQETESLRLKFKISIRNATCLDSHVDFE
jgi:hypothetical protein